MDRMEQQKKMARWGLEHGHAFNSLVGKLPGVVYRCRLDQNWTMEYVSEGCLELTGYRPEELEHNGKVAYEELIYPADRRLLREKIHTAVQASKPYTLEYRIITADGKVKWVWEQGLGIMDHQGLTFLEGYIADITDRVRLEEALRRSEEHYRDILDSIEEGYYEVDLKGRFVYCNNAIYRWTGYTPEEMLGKSFKILAKNPEEVYKAYNFVFSAGDPKQDFLWTVVNKDGREYFAENSISLIKDQQGNLTGFRGIVRDITERRRAALEIERQKTHFEALFTHSTDAIIYFDAEERLVKCNRQFTILFGYTAEEVKGKKMSALIFRSRKKRAIADLSRKLLQGESLKHEFVAYHRHGQPIEVIMKGVPVVIDGRVAGGYAIFSDITDHKRHVRQLEYLSMHDPLTDAYNRAYFDEELHRLSDGREFPVSIIVADIDGLKHINDTFGHSVGDDLLKAGAKVLQASVRRRDVVARIGGDEFVLLLPKTTVKMAAEVVRRIADNAKNHNLKDTDHRLSFSLGAATTVHTDSSLMNVFKDADNKMYCNKREKKQLSTDGVLALRNSKN